jgi:hypothetical protein
MRSIKETIMQLTGKRRGNRDASDILRSLVTLRFALEQTDMDLASFAKQHAVDARLHARPQTHEHNLLKFRDD